jgi:hypothetical protein
MLANNAKFEIWKKMTNVDQFITKNVGQLTINLDEIIMCLTSYVEIG